MHNAYVVTGKLTGTRTVELDETLPVASANVRLVVELLSPTTRVGYAETMRRIRDRQKARGHQSPSAESNESYLKQERESWE